MEPRKLTVLIVSFAYGGNGGVSSECPDIKYWTLRTYQAITSDKRVGKVAFAELSDTPITMTRNRAAQMALEGGFDVLVMVDSDMKPDKRLLEGDPLAKPFWESSFDFLYNHYDKGPVCVFAPYCGPDPVSMVYIFRWENTQNGDHNAPGLKMDMFPRTEAVRMAGISNVDGAGTGLCLWDTRLFNVLPKPWFDYEWKGDGPCCATCGQPKPGVRAEKASTEDCVHTRDMSLVGVELLGYNPVFCNWDAWAGHWKPKCIDKPYLPTATTVNHRMREAVLRGHQQNERMVMIPAEGVEQDGRFAVRPDETGRPDVSRPQLNGDSPQKVPG